MTTIHIHRGDDPEIVVDCAPIEKYETELRAAIDKREFHRPSIDALVEMDREQLLHLSSILTSMVLEYARLYDSSFSPEHEKLVRGLREVKQAADEAGVELWEKWPELSEVLK